MKKKKSLKIAIFCETEFAIPPSSKMKDIYAPLFLTHAITEGLVKRGHKVTLFAPSDSKTKAKLVSDNLISLANNKNYSKYYRQITELDQESFFWQLAGRRSTVDNYDFLLLSKLFKTVASSEFDIVYISLIGMRAIPFACTGTTPTVLTIHAAPDPLTIHFFKEYKKRNQHLHFVGISKNQTKVAPKLFTEVVYNGLDFKKYPFSKTSGKYLLFSGRVSREKGTREAIEVAERLKIPLYIYGRHTEDPYWYKEIKPRLGKYAIYKGFAPHWKMPSIYKNAKATLMPLSWEEPFGLVMPESMATGTPVIAFKRGSIPEIIKNGVNGFIVKDINEMVEKVKNVEKMNRQKVRASVVDKFSNEKMVDGYEDLFFKILKSKTK